MIVKFLSLFTYDTFMRWRNIALMFDSVRHLFHISPFFAKNKESKSTSTNWSWHKTEGGWCYHDHAMDKDDRCCCCCCFVAVIVIHLHIPNHTTNEKLWICQPKQKIQRVSNTITLINIISNGLQSSQHEIVSFVPLFWIKNRQQKHNSNH